MTTWFGSNLLILRSRLGTSQEEMANRLNLKRATLGVYEAQKSDCTFETLLKICEYFNISVEDILMYDLSGKTEFESFGKLRIENLRRNITINRLVAGYTQEYVAKKLNVKRNTYCNWEVGRSNPNFSHFMDIATIYRKNLDHFFKKLEINECD